MSDRYCGRGAGCRRPDGARRSADPATTRLEIRDARRHRLPDAHPLLPAPGQRPAGDHGDHFAHVQQAGIFLIASRGFNGSRCSARPRSWHRELFLSLAEARWVVDCWRLDYNHRRPHSALDYQTPAEFAARCAASTP
ncbi:MAG: transposase, partial [Planctomycetes bacterium]|nr:transposase [Planctomycetota bacterium]